MALRSPWSLTHPVLSPRCVLVVKLIALSWFVTGQVTAYPGLRVPLLPLLGSLPSTPFTLTLLFLGVLGTLLVWFTAATRTGCLALAASIGLGFAGDLSFFSNNRLFTCVILGLVSLLQHREQERFLAWQCGIVFFGAALDKTLSADWRSGLFMASFVHGLSEYGLLWSPGGDSGGAHPIAQILSQTAGPRFYWLLSWFVILGEWILAALWILQNRFTPLANTAFYLGLIVLTGSTMGMFAFAGTAVGLLLIPGLGEEDRIGDHPLYWALWVGLLGSPLFSQTAALLAALLIYGTYRRRLRR